MTITAQEVKQRLDAGEKLHIIDVREVYEFEESNIPTAKNIPLSTISSQIVELDNLKNEELIMQCRSGQRSKVAQQLLLQAGFSNVKNFEGGILAWQALG
jgi:rhodanese-related sulfurtransferase